MGIRLRAYQSEAVERAIEHFRTSDERACLVLPTGAGKSLVISELCRRARGRVLVLAHVKELCEQNFDKYQRLVANDPEARAAGIYSAGLNRRDCTEPVIFGSIQSVSRHLDDLLTSANETDAFSLVLVDECHRVSQDDASQYSKVIETLTSCNPRLKVLGLTATPYRLGLGWAYRQHFERGYRTEAERPFEHCVYEVTLRRLVDEGFLTPAIVEDAPVATYDFGAFGAGLGETDEVNRLLVSHRRVTRSIVEDVVSIAQEEGRRGVMIFASTVEHAREIQSYLPEGQSALVLGETTNDERDELVSAFVEQRLRYLVNVSVLTTGFDAPHVDFIAVLRKTDSVSLFQQIVGRGLRLHPGKVDCRVIDYAGNGYDLFAPEIGERKPSADSRIVPVACPDCAFENRFWGTCDEDGRVVEHHGRRCQGKVSREDGVTERCRFRFRFKECERCAAENDIAARSCEGCGRTLVDPDEMLRDALRLKDALVLRVAGRSLKADGSRLRITYHDEDGATVSEWFDFAHTGQRAVFNRVFGRRIAGGRRPLALEAPEHAVLLDAHLPTPDFVVARKKKKGRAAYFQIQTRVFDYEGNFRVADRAPAQ